jgi:hypothetical protein
MVIYRASGWTRIITISPFYRDRPVFFLKRALILHLKQGTWFWGVREDFQQIVIVGLFNYSEEFSSRSVDR